MSKKALTDLVRIRGEIAASTGEDGLQRQGAFIADADIGSGSDDDVRRGGRGCRAEEAKGEGGEDREDERTHCERLMSVLGVKRVIWLGERRRE